MRKLVTIVILVMAVMAAVVAPLAEIYLPKQSQAIDKLVFFPAKYPALA